jgi:hypothetical protein
MYKNKDYFTGTKNACVPVAEGTHFLCERPELNSSVVFSSLVFDFENTTMCNSHFDSKWEVWMRYPLPQLSPNPYSRPFRCCCVLRYRMS